MKRRAGKRRAASRITPEAVAAYAESRWLDLHRALGLPPWATSPLDVPTHGQPPRGFDPDAWASAQELRRELEAVINLQQS